MEESKLHSLAKLIAYRLAREGVIKSEYEDFSWNDDGESSQDDFVCEVEEIIIDVMSNFLEHIEDN